MKIREIEAKILAAIGTRGDITIAELSKLTQLRVHVCRNAIDTMLRRNMIFRRVVVNPCALGNSIYVLWFSLNPKHSARRSKFLKWIVDHDSVGYLGEFEGEYSFKIDIYAKNINELNQFMADLTTNFGEIILKESLSCMLSFLYLGYKFFAPQSSQRSAIQIGALGDATVEIDETDHKILREICSIRNLSNAAVARKIGIAATTLDYRVKRLRERKVIVGYQIVAEVGSMYALGHAAYAHRVRLTSLEKGAIDRVRKFANSDPSVYSMTHVVGSFQIEICTVGDSLASKSAFCRRLESELGELINCYSSSVVVAHHKMNSYPFNRLSSPI